MLTFSQFIVEFALSDIRYFKALPNVDPPSDVANAQQRYGFKHIDWKLVKNKSFTHSRDLGDNTIAMVQGDIAENWWHELGHEIYDHCDKEAARPILDRIKAAYGQERGKGLKWLEVGGYDYSYSHSGVEFEYDELFAISYAFIEGDEGEFDDSDIDKDFRALLQKLQDEPHFNEHPDATDKV